MRHFGYAFFAFVLASTAIAQQQERSLVDRLLKPQTTLRNSQQNKKFSDASPAELRSSTTNAFYLPQKNLTKNFLTDRRVATASYLTSHFVTEGAALPKPRANGEFPTRRGPAVSSYFEVEKKVPLREYEENRPFRVRGKSQKILDAQHRSLTIEDVRELLNKNK